MCNVLKCIFCSICLQLKTDSDGPDDAIKYVLFGEGAGTIFVMNENLGNIYVLKKLDREEKPFYTLRAQAINRITGVPVETESEFVIKVLDINDNEPKFINEPYIAEVSETSPKGTDYEVLSYYFKMKYLNIKYLMIS